MEKIQILVLIVLHPSSDIMRASAWPLEPTGQDTENHLAQSVNESDGEGPRRPELFRFSEKRPSLGLMSHQEPCPHHRGLGAREDPQRKKEHRSADYSSKVLQRGRPTAGWPSHV